MFKVTWVNYGELDNTSSDFCELTYDVSEHLIFYRTCNGIRHSLRCDFGGIFDKIHFIVSSDEFQNEKPYEDGCDGDWYKFEYTLNDELLSYEGYIYGLKLHEEIVSLIKSCAKNILDDEKKLLQHKYIDNDDTYSIRCKNCGEILTRANATSVYTLKCPKCNEDTVNNLLKRWSIDCEILETSSTRIDNTDLKQELEDNWDDLEDNWDDWDSINSIIQIPEGFIKCDKCESIIHNKYFKNRKYWGREWISDDELGEYEVEYDSGECPVCGQLNTELPYSGLDFQPYSFENNQDNIFDSNDEDKLYSLAEVDSYLKNLSEDGRSKLKDCKFKLHKDYPDDDSGEIYYSFRIYRNNIIVGWIDMNSYSLTLYEDSKENFSSENIKNPFDDSKFRCSKCGKVFCSCDKFFSKRG